MTDIVERLDPVARFCEVAGRTKDGHAIRDAMDQLTRDAAEIVRLRGEVDALRQCGIKYLGWLGVKDAENALRKDMADPEMVERPAPAMPNGVEYDRELIAEILDQFRDALTNGELDGAGCYTPGTIDEQAQLLRDAESREAGTVARAADNRDAAGVSDDDFVHPEYIRGFNDGAKATPAAAPAGEAVACDMGPLCIGCTPRNADGSCPDAAPQRADGEAVAWRRGILAAQGALHDVSNRRRHPQAVAYAQELLNALMRLYTHPPAAQVQQISAGDAVFAFSAMLTSLPHVVPFGAAAWATPGVDLATAFNAANGLTVSRDLPGGIKFAAIEGELLDTVKRASEPEAAHHSACELGADAARFRWLTDDLAGDARTRRNQLLRSMQTMSYSAACTDIDHAMRETAALQHRGDSRGGGGSAMKRKCENCGDKCEQDTVIATPNCEWICTDCFAEDPEAYGFDFDLDGDELP